VHLKHYLGKSHFLINYIGKKNGYSPTTNDGRPRGESLKSRAIAVHLKHYLGKSYFLINYMGKKNGFSKRMEKGKHFVFSIYLTW
jgi:hypothetical protein